MVTAIDRTELLRLIESEKAQVVNVLPRHEYDEAHIPGSVSIPLRDLTAGAASSLSRHDPMVVYCHDGLCDMSPRAACRLERLGFTQVFDYVTGLVDWMAAGLPVEGHGDEKQRIADATRPDVPTCQPDEQVTTIRPRINEAGWQVCVVVDCDGVVVGQIRSPAIDEHEEVEVHQVMEPGPFTVRPDGLLQPLVERMGRHDTPHALVTTGQGELLGILIREEAERLLAGEPPQQVWRNCEGCPGRWAAS